MNPIWKKRLIASFCSIFAIYAGFQIADGSIGLLALLGAFLVLASLQRWTGIRAETWILCSVLIGYIVGNRGFAQQLLPGTLPLLPAEAALMSCGVIVLVRGAMARRFPIDKDSLSLAILAWMVISLARLPWDMRTHGFIALRDAATVYYAAFFFITVYAARQVTDQKALAAALTIALGLLPPLFFLSNALPYFFTHQLALNGVPLIVIKPDLASTYSGAALLWFYFRQRAKQGAAWLNLVFFLGNFALFAYAIGRSTIVAMMGVCLLLFYAREGRFVLRFAAVAVLAMTISVAVAIFQDRDLSQTHAYGFLEKARSILDVSGSGAYQSSAALSSPDNNRFRLVWWRQVLQETFAGGPIFGLGWGYDLAAGFSREYFGLEDESFTVRSPHNILITLFGRSGFLGLASFLAVVAAGAAQGFGAIRRHRDSPAYGTVALWTGGGLYFVCACFGVVLEGPMGAIPFWIILGLAQQEAETAGRHATAAGAASLGNDTAPLPAPAGRVY
ncbi:MAG: O-antigen ligase family protein [Opitutaceae bacterium]|nr:O-antigen ligase family protein [Opitutaceae bacterium]